MFHSLRSSVPDRRLLRTSAGLLAFALACPLSACVPDEPGRPTATPANPNTSLLAEPPGFESPAGGRPAEQVHAERVDERARRRAIGENRDRSAVGPPLDVRGTVVTAATGRPEVDCLVSLGNEQARTDQDGGFLLRDVPSDGQVRVRFRCRGIVERHTIDVPAGTGEVRLDEPVLIGPRRDEEPSRTEPTTSATTSAAAQAFAAAGEDIARSMQAGTSADAAGARPQGDPDSRSAPGGQSGQSAPTNPALPTTVSGQQAPAGSSRPPDGVPPAAAATGERGDDARATAGSATATTHPGSPARAPETATEPAAAAPATTRQAVREAPPALPLTHEWSISGGLGEDAVVDVLVERVLAIRNCYRSHFDGDIWRRGAIEATWRVEPDGSVTAASVQRTSFNDAEADACVVRRLQRLAFPAAEEPTLVQQRFVFALDLGPRAQLRPE